MNFKRQLVFSLIFLCAGLVCAQEEVSASKNDSISDTTLQGEDIDEQVSISYQYTDDIVRRNFDSSFKSRYKAEAFEYEPKIKQFHQWEQFKQWVISWIRRFFNLTDKNAASQWFDYFIKFLALLLVMAVVYFIVKAILNKEGGWIFGRDSQAEKIDHTNVEEKLHLANFKELINSAKLKGDYRLTIRFYYLWLLRKLSEKKYITWDINKTNMDYLYELKDKRLRKRFDQHCYVYDYVWYGEFALSDEEFQRVEQSFNETMRGIDE